MSKPLNRPIRVLIIDDSPFIRMTLKTILSRDPDIQVVDMARDGSEGILKLKEHRPDVITLDVEMPVMDGLQALREIMRWQPTPAIIVSSLTTEEASLTMKAFDLGAVDVVAKPVGNRGNDLNTLASDLILKVKSVAEIDPRKLFRARTAGQQTISAERSAGKNSERPQEKRNGGGYRGPAKDMPKHRIDIVAIGTSTGGPSALQTVLGGLSGDIPVPIVVAQHMPPGFTASLANRLNGICAVSIKEIENGELLKPGIAYIGQSGMQMMIERSGGDLIARVSDQSPISTLYKPSVDVMFMSLAKAVGAGVLGVVLTGMGNDGRAGMKELKAEGAYSIAESEKTCIVYGMPRSIVDAGLADRVELLSDISKIIMECTARR
ncbi:response regulator receiver modulated CheB methylesterase [Syntrophobotulus glycolicus DSM 8271]|uniref:Protein-glutamate methylesterase/protein-glutamine glutaminase n=1 Tax=Syntrophobotulus glycolicus (strain DSM 8271 / FlGlyR) TaxID=645991 RepID=F0SZF0_SYNGF|nr:chemotaxis response regulator protein-glutamate methylesterase [Syntrophobotulus glycolicus]ADY54955.1 response regulator receiver modulated CheB methylesterase [Syntrophobotulus glycolicus DSM 8271]